MKEKKEKKKRRAKGTGHIFLRGKKYYLLFENAEGKQQMKSLDTENKVKAEANAKEELEKVKKYRNATEEELLAYRAIANRNIKTASKKTLPLSDVWDKYDMAQNRPQSSPGTHKNYERIWGRIQAWLKDNHPEITTLDGITTETSKQYTTYLWEQGISANTFNYHVKALALVTRVLSMEAGVEVNPWTKEHITRKTQVKQKRKEFTKDQVKNILEAFTGSDIAIPNKDEMKCLFYIGAYTGLRLADAVLLKWNSVNLVRNTIQCTPIKTAKTQREVAIPILSPLRKELKAAELWKDESDYVLPRLQERYKTHNTMFKKAVLKVFEDCGIKGKSTAVRGIDRSLYGFHSMRHYFATECAAIGIPIVDLAEYLGDNVSTLGRYYIHAKENRRHEIETALSFAPPALPGGMSAEQKLAEIKKLLTGKSAIVKKISQILEA